MPNPERFFKEELTLSSGQIRDSIDNLRAKNLSKVELHGALRDIKSKVSKVIAKIESDQQNPALPHSERQHLRELHGFYFAIWQELVDEVNGEQKAPSAKKKINAD